MESDEERAWSIYARKGEIHGDLPSRDCPAGGAPLIPCVPLRSSPAAIVEVANATGTTSCRVTVTIRGKQRKFVTRDRAAAEAKQTLWEAERLLGANASRPKFTFLTSRQLRQAEAAIEFPCILR